MAEKLERGEETFDGCFGCGPTNERGLHLEFSREGDEIFAELSVSADYAGYQDFVHGGIVAAILDEAQGWAIVNVARSYAVTQSLNITYRRPVGVGKPLRARARVLEQDGKRLSLESRLEDDRGRLLASAVGQWVSVRRERAMKKAQG